MNILSRWSSLFQICGLSQHKLNEINLKIMYPSKHCTIYLNEINNWEAETTTNMLKIHRLIYRHDWLIIKMIKIRIPLLKKKKKMKSCFSLWNWSFPVWEITCLWSINTVFTKRYQLICISERSTYFIQGLEAILYYLHSSQTTEWAQYRVVVCPEWFRGSLAYIL